MLVWRDKIACHDPIARHIAPLSLSLPPPLTHLILSIRCASGCRHDTRLCTRFPRYDKQRDAVATTGLVDTRDVISAFRATTSCEMNERFEVERPRNHRTNHSWIMFEDLPVEGKKFMEKARKREREILYFGERNLLWLVFRG